MTSLPPIPPNLPEPIDDGGCDHLVGMSLPNISLAATNGKAVQISSLQGLAVLFAYPMTGKPGTALPDGWCDIPGAAGCTPQNCEYRDNYKRFEELSVDLYGISTQTNDDQLEASGRLQLPYRLLSDASLELTNSLTLPTFMSYEKTLLRRFTMICENAKIVHCVYPVFPSHADVELVLGWIAQNRG